MTKQRQLILDIVNTAHCHPTAEQVFFMAKEKMSGIVMATVYNNLNALVELNKIRRVSFHGDADRFDTVHTPHEHLKCDKCGEVHDLFTDDMLDDLKGKFGIALTGYGLNLHYICDACRSNDI